MNTNYNPFSLEGKTILITGASSGIGRATAIECSRMGAKLIITGRNLERLNETFVRLHGDGHVQVPADLTNQEDVDNLLLPLPVLNGLVLCAGRSAGSIPFAYCSREKFDSVFNVNFFSPVELLRTLLKQKKLMKGSSVVFVDSIGGTPGGKFSFGGGIYGTSKAALWSIMRFSARELAGKLIRVNSVNPGMVETKLIHNGVITDDQLAADVKNYPLKRYGQPNDIAHGIIYLLSDASSWVTGHSLVIDGGVTI